MDFFVLDHNLVSNRWSSTNLKLGIYDHGVVMQVMFLQDVLSNRSYCPLVFKMSMNCHKLASNRRNLMKLILSIYDHNVMVHALIHEDVIRCREVA